MEFATFVANQANEPILTEQAPSSYRPTSAFSSASELQVLSTARPFKGKQIRKKKAIFGFFGHDPFRAKQVTATQLESAQDFHQELLKKITRSEENESEAYHARTQNIMNVDTVVMAPQPVVQDPKTFRDRIAYDVIINHPEELKDQRYKVKDYDISYFGHGK
jgi:hypothetical protein